MRRDVLILLGLMAAIAVVATLRRPPSEAAAPTLSVHGVRLGTDYEELKARMGRPSGGRDDGQIWEIKRWGDFDEVRLAKQKVPTQWRVVHLDGRQLELDGRAVLRAGDPWSERTVLGVPIQTRADVECYSFPLAEPIWSKERNLGSAQVTLFRQGDTVNQVRIECAP